MVSRLYERIITAHAMTYKDNNLKIYNSLSNEKETFTPLQEGHVGMYVCGPTVYSNVHLGNVRTFISFDIIYRYLLHLGYKVRYVRNITDVGHLVDDVDEGEDKIVKRARLEQLEPMEIVQRYTVNFHDTLKQFNLLSPSIEPTATGHIIEQINVIQKAIDNGYAYESNGHRIICSGSARFHIAKSWLFRLSDCPSSFRELLTISSSFRLLSTPYS